MKCPNCGRKVRSKKQCAHCGHVFGKDDLKHQVTEPENKPVKEIKKQSEPKVEKTPKAQKQEVKANPQPRHSNKSDFKEVEIVPKTPRKKGGILKFIWGLIKLMLMIAIVFLAFMFGPQMINGIMGVVNGDSEISSLMPDFVSNLLNKEETTLEETTQEITEEKSGLTLANSSVDTENYPVINVKLDFNEPLDEVNNETFTFKLKNATAEKELGKDYSLIKKGQSLNMSFTDPDISTDVSEPQTLLVESTKMNFSEEIQLSKPKNNVDKKQSETFNEILTNNFKDIGNVSAMVQKVKDKDKMNLVYEDQTQDAGEFMAWFVLARTYQAIEDNYIKLDQMISVNPELIATNDAGEMASAGEGSEFTVERLIALVIQQKDLTAMNHLIQETGGPNDFNLWLNESNYFSTKVTERLGYDEQGKITGAVTNAQNVVYLLNELANNKLVSQEKDAAFKEQILQSPITAKYPENMTVAVNNRYEIATDDGNTDHQYYSAIIETEQAQYLVTIFVNDITDPMQVNQAIAQTINDLMTLLENGEVNEETTEESSQESTEVNNQVQLEGETGNQTNPQQPSTQPGPQDQYSLQYVQGQGQVLLPVIRDNAGNPIQVNWYFDQADQMYKY